MVDGVNPSLFALAVNKDASVDDYYEHVLGLACGNLFLLGVLLRMIPFLLDFCLSAMGSLPVVLVMIQSNGILIPMGSSLSSLSIKKWSL